MSRLVTVRVFMDLPEAVVARGLLDSHGIPAVIADWNMVTVNWETLFAIGGLRLQVPEADLEWSHRVLAEALAHPIPHNRLRHCPSCGATDVTYRRRTRRLPYFPLVVVGLLLFLKAYDLQTTLLLMARLMPVTTYGECDRCGHRWRADQEPEPDDAPAA